MWESKTDEELVQHILTPGANLSPAEAMLESRSALNELLSRHYSWIMRVCVSELRSESLSLDCGQEVLTRISLSIKNFKRNAKFSTWCYVILRRTIWEFRKNKRRLDSREELSFDATVSSQPEAVRSGDNSSPLDAIDSRQRTAVLWTHLEELPAKQREAIVLHYFDDLSVADAAERVGCSVSSFKTHLFRGREKLKTLIERHKLERV